MKKIIFTLSVIILIAACNNNKKNKTNRDSGDETKSVSEKKITKRDFSITPENAYNNLFFDSLVLVNFISENKIDESLARRMRSFYNARL